MGSFRYSSGWLYTILGAALVAAATVTCSGGDSVAVQGTLEVTTSTNGAEPDPDGYTVQLDAEPPQDIGSAATLRIPDIPAGDHTVRLEGLAANCAVAGDNPRTVSLTNGEITTVSFTVTCGATTGGLQVSVSTSGPSPDADGYGITVDGAQRATLAATGVANLTGLTVGDHEVGLSAIAANCQVDGDNPRTVTITPGEDAALSFAVTCSTPPQSAGTILVRTSTTGTNLDPNGYSFALDGGSTQPIAVSTTADLTNVAVGNHSVRLSGVAQNCTLQGSNPRTVSVTSGATVEASFAITCTGIAPGPPASVTITIQPSPNATSGRPFSRQPVVEVRDAAGNLLDEAQVSVSIESGGGTLGGTFAVVTDNGVARFTNLSITGAAGARTLRFQAGSASAVSESVVVSATVESELGQWTPPFEWPQVAVHLHLLRNGQVLSFSLEREPHVWNQSSNSFTRLTTSTELVCSGHAFLPDGRLLITGGHIDSDRGLPDVNIYDPGSRSFARVTPMAKGRWYPTTTTLANGEMLTVGGADEGAAMVLIPEVWTGNDWRSLSNASLRLPYYPWMFQAPNGKVFYAGWDRMSRYLDPQGAGSWTDVGTSIYGDREAGTAVMYEPGKVLIVGGGGGRLAPGTRPTATAETIDLNSGSPAWRTTGSMAFARRHFNVTLLPTGEVFVVGGTNGTGFNNAAGSVHAAEIWNPETGRWKTVAANAINRIYHSTSLLMPDGRVLVAGAGENFDPDTRKDDVDQFNAELYAPPYLFRGPRPTVSGAPTNLGYGSSFSVATSIAGSIARVTLVRLGSVTHGFDENQRFISLAFQPQGAGLSVSAPANGNLAPPGHYMLFLVNRDGVPSVGRIVRLQ